MLRITGGEVGFSATLPDLAGTGLSMVRGLTLLLRRNSEFISNIATLFTGKSAAIAVSFALTPIVARLFTPEDFGVVALFVSIMAVLSTFATLRFDLAIVLPQSDDDAIRLTQLAAWMLVPIAGTVLIATGVLAWLDFSLPLVEQLGPWVLAIAPALAVYGVANAVEGWLVRKRGYRAIAISELGMTSVTGVTRIGAGAFFGSSVWGLMTGFLLGRVARLVMLWRAMPRHFPVLPVPPPTTDFLRLAREYSDFPTLSAPTGFLKGFAQNLPVVMLGIMFAPEIVGFYAMANRLVRLPLDVTAMAVRRVYLQKMAELANRGHSLSGPYVKTTLALAVLGLPPCIALWFGGEWLLTLFLGERWATAGHYVALLVPWLYAIWISISVAALVVVLRRQGLWLKRQIIIGAAQLAVFGVAWGLEADAEWTISAFVAVATLGNLSTVALGYSLAIRKSIVQIPEPAGNGARADARDSELKDGD